jgi:hypothetical protein
MRLRLSDATTSAVLAEHYRAHNTKWNSKNFEVITAAAERLSVSPGRGRPLDGEAAPSGEI